MDKPEKFTSSPLYDYFRKTDSADLPVDEKEALDEKHDVTDLLKKDIIFRLLNEKFFIMYITAKGGEGKSTIARNIYNFVKRFVYETEQGKELIEKWKKRGFGYPKYTIDYWCFTDREFLSLSGNAVPLEVIVKDEDYETFAQIGGKAQKERKRMLLSRIRALQINYILNDPVFDDNKISGLYHYKVYANDISYDGKKNRAIVYVQDYNGVWLPVGHMITKDIPLEGYDEKKKKQLLEIKKMQQPEYKRKQMERIVKALVFWKNKDGIRDDIRNYQKNCWAGMIKMRLDEMGEGGLKAGTEIKEIKDAIDAFFPIQKER